MENRGQMNIAECIMMGGCRNYLALIIASILVVILIIVGVVFYLIRRKRNMNAYRLTWKVPKDSLKVIESKQFILFQSKGKTTSENLSSKRRTIELYALMGSAKAEFICLKQDKRIRWTKQQQKFLFELKSLNHENLTNFLGICYNDGDRFYILHTLVERASLEDFIFDHEFNMDATFRSAFIKDIIKGLQYLHKSQIGFHGMLSLRTCLIDANWVLKMTNFGISNMLHELIESEYLRMMELIPQQHYITVAPELLQNIHIGRTYPRGTVAGDIYSFGMALFSILYRCEPFEKTNMALRGEQFAPCWLGLQYLHKSQIGFHGMLSLRTCLIDANWVLKMTNFGISNMLHELIESEYLRMMELIPQQHYITVAPELLQNIHIGRTYPRGTVAGDIYSFGMALFSILYRCEPFEKTNMALREIIEGVAQKGLKPAVQNPEGDPLITMMCQCWNSPAEARPKLRTIHQTVTAAFASSKGNLVDQMIKMNEKYAQNLERIVAERTSMLVEAQEQTDRLLCEMLPPTIAAQLKAGKPIIPRSYDSVTVAFCQIVDFGVLMGKCTPDQVIAFLNDVFTTFDEIIGKHDAYKVETTGETYMVASGVPNENEGRHVYEISEIALEIRQKTLTYKVAYAPDWKLRVRIGFHCGPIAAGVIGLRSPRYCLFGDTLKNLAYLFPVNFASRMQSNCQPNQIQMAESTAMILMQSSEYRLTKRGIVHVKGKGKRIFIVNLMPKQTLFCEEKYSD
uniref:guanylate cyclase n=1 Tax=Ascaris lumbricoides TaxID=6252 RepID=A0A9J2Q887_ASCLU